MDKYFFEIPIFRCTKNQFILEGKAELNSLIEYFKFGNQGIKYDYEKLALSSLRSKASSYFYGELIGMIRLFLISGQIRAELYFVNQKISKKLARKTWVLKSRKVFEVWIRRGDTNESIYERVVKRIGNCHKESKTISKFYIDMECFKTVGKFIDFLHLNNEINKEK